MYLALQGEVTLFKRPESYYTTEGKRIKTDEIKLWANPKDSGNDSIGMPVTYMKAKCLVAEDAVFFK